MSILFNRAKVSFIELTYLNQYPFNVDYQVFEYPANINVPSFKFLYYYLNNTLGTISIANTELLPGTNRRLLLKLGHAFTSYYCYPGMKLKVLAIENTSAGIDFIDKYGQAGTVYAYESFTITNDSMFNKLTNISVTSENLLIGFLNSYPCRFKHVKYDNGVPSYAINLNYSGINTTKLKGFFNGTYKGTAAIDGYITGFTSPKPGVLDIVYSGDTEFSFSLNGPWSTVLIVPDMLPLTQLTVYARSGQVITAPIKILNSVKIFAMEVV